MAKKFPAKNKADNPWVLEAFRTMSLVMSKVGIVGFTAISIVIYIFWFVPQALKNEITETWILFKCKDCEIQYTFLFLILVVLIIIQNYFYKKAIKLKDQRILDISKEKKMLQEKLLNKELNSSNKT